MPKDNSNALNYVLTGDGSYLNKLVIGIWMSTLIVVRRVYYDFKKLHKINGLSIFQLTLSISASLMLTLIRFNGNLDILTLFVRYFFLPLTVLFLVFYYVRSLLPLIGKSIATDIYPWMAKSAKIAITLIILGFGGLIIAIFWSVAKSIFNI